MTAFAIIEQNDLAKDPRVTASRGTNSLHRLVVHRSFRTSREFSEGLRACVSDLLAVHGCDARLLVISVHGRPLTGTYLEASFAEALNLYEFSDHFAGLPSWLMVYVSACFGGYPSAAAIQERSSPPPLVIGPLVDIHLADANAFQVRLLDHLAKLSPSGTGVRPSLTLLKLVAGENRKLRAKYNNRETFGLFTQQRTFFPARTQGAQLAAPVTEVTNYTVEEEACVREDGLLTHVYVRDDDHVLYLAGSAPLMNSQGKVAGTRFRGRHQVLVSNCDAEPRPVALFQVAWRR